MKTKALIIIIAAALCGLAQNSHAQDIDSFAPVVVKTVPEAGSKDVPPGEYIVHVTFSKEMMDNSWSWSVAWKDSAPEMIGKPKYSADHKVCAIAVKLEPGKTYGWWINSENFHNFKDAQGHAAMPYLLTFQSASMTRPAPAPAVSRDIHIDPANGLPVPPIGALPPEASINIAFSTQDEVHKLIANGQYDEALQRCLSFHNQIKNNVNLVVLLTDWAELGRRFPKAKEALIEIRDHDVQEFSEGRGYFDLFQEVKVINDSLHQDDSTYALFKAIREKDPALAQQCFFSVESLLVAKGEYQSYYDQIGGDPQGKFDSIRQFFTMQIDQQKRMADLSQKTTQRIAEMNRKNGITNSWSPPDTSAMMKKNAENSFAGQTRQLIEVLVATGHQADAEKIRDEAVAVLDNAHLHSAVTDAEQKIKK